MSLGQSFSKLVKKRTTKNYQLITKFQIFASNKNKITCKHLSIYYNNYNKMILVNKIMKKISISQIYQLHRFIQKNLNCHHLFKKCMILWRNFNMKNI